MSSAQSLPRSTEATASLTTIDFTANGGDGYPFAAAGIEFENAVSSITYQQALQEYISDPLSEGSLGGVISASRCGVADPLDPAGRLVDLAISPVPEADAWATLLAGPGLPGFAARRRMVAV